MTRILIIDNEKDFAEMVSSYFAAKDEFETIVETDPENAVSMARLFMPDLILLDIIMPKKNGFEVLESLKKDRRTASIPVIILTVVNGMGSKIKAAECYAEDYVVKPVSLRDLKTKVDAVLKRRYGVTV